MSSQIITETLFPRLGFIPVCFSTWRKREIYLRVKSIEPNVVEVLFGSQNRKLRDIEFLHQLQDIYKSIYDEDLLLK